MTVYSNNQSTAGFNIKNINWIAKSRIDREYPNCSVNADNKHEMFALPIMCCYVYDNMGCFMHRYSSPW